MSGDSEWSSIPQYCSGMRSPVRRVVRLMAGSAKTAKAPHLLPSLRWGLAQIAPIAAVVLGTRLEVAPPQAVRTVRQTRGQRLVDSQQLRRLSHVTAG